MPCLRECGKPPSLATFLRDGFLTFKLYINILYEYNSNTDP